MTDIKATPMDQTPDVAPPPRRPRIAMYALGILAIGMMLAGVLGFGFYGKLPNVEKNDNASFLPASAESTKVADEAERFLKVESAPGFLVFYRDTGLTSDDKSHVEQMSDDLSTLHGIDHSTLFPVQYSKDGTAAALYAPISMKDHGQTKTSNDLSAAEKEVLDKAKSLAGDSLHVYPAGLAGIFSAFNDVVSGLGMALFAATLAVVVVILLIVYRSPVLWLFPLFTALLSLGMAMLIVYGLAKAGVVTLTGQSVDILFVLGMGAGTDYALLLISRYREELHRYANRFDAMWVAWKESAAAIFASATTVIIGVMCLSFSQLNSNKGLGPVAAIGIGCTVLFMMLFLPVALAAAGRWVFWPRRPKFDHTVDPAEIHGIWTRISNGIGRHRRVTWMAATGLLLLGVLSIGQLNTSGLSIENSFTKKPAAVVGQEIYNNKFPQGTGAPANITVEAGAASKVISAVSGLQGIATAPGSVCMQVDPDKAKKNFYKLLSATDCPPAELDMTPVDGRVMINAVLTDSFDSPAAMQTVQRLRDTLHAIPEAQAMVGGTTAISYDVKQAASRDNRVIIPIVLAVIFVVLMLLLRAVVAPIVLIASVVLSFAATLGVCGLVFTHVFHFAGSDQSFPLFAFVFLVALGIDYNIFLMTRVREETRKVGTRAGILRGLAVTGGVITSAGAVLAATFAVLGVVPVVLLAEVGFAVAFGVLLDTIVVRSILVPAIAYDIGKKIWWPSRLSREAE